MRGLLWIFFTIAALAGASACVEHNRPGLGLVFVLAAAMASSYVIWQ